MPMSKNLAAYSDIAAAFDAALVHSGGTLIFDTKGKARNWQQRAYYYRQLLKGDKPEYHTLQLKHVDFTVVISMKALDAVFTTPTGEVVAINVETDLQRDLASDEADSPLLADALSFVQTIKS